MSLWATLTSTALRICSRCYAEIREGSRKFAQNRPVIPRCYALLRVRPFLAQSNQMETDYD